MFLTKCEPVTFFQGRESENGRKEGRKEGGKEAREEAVLRWLLAFPVRQ